MEHPAPTRTSAIFALCLLAGGLVALPAIADQYDPPAGYYSTATATTGPALELQLHDIIDGHIYRSYDVARQALAITDVDPNNVNNLISIYDGQSLPKIWDSGATWNREHTWPRSRGVGDSGPDNSDLHMLRPAWSATNGSRGNKPFGTASGYFDPGTIDRGEIARTMFYAAVRYDGSDSSTTDLTLVPGFPSGNQMGDLTLLMQWHYAYPPEQRERRRNHVIWSSNPADWYDPVVNVNSTLYNQGNRNPFVDHPEYAWVIWGGSGNNSTLYVGPSHASDGSSSTIIDLGRTISPAQPASMIVALNKDNAHPAAYRVSVSGDATSPQAGLPQSYPYTPAPAGVSAPTVTVGVDASGVGDYMGDVVIDNAELNSAGTGQGSADAADTITVLATVLNHSNGSFNDPSDVNTLHINFGSVPQNATPPSAPFFVHNLSGSYLAGLDLDSVTTSGDTGVLTTTLTTFTDLDSGDDQVFTAALDTGATPGSYSATYTLHLSDENIPGATGGQTLTLTLMATIAPPSPCVGDLDGDFDTDVLDFALFSAGFGAGPGATHDQGDLNGDGYVNVLDFSILVADFACGG